MSESLSELVSESLSELEINRINRIITYLNKYEIITSKTAAGILKVETAFWGDFV